MKKEQFLSELEYLLQDIPEFDREEAMAYYRDYLMEAGEENETAAIESFGSPERAAALIRADLAGNLKDKNNGFFTETGYEDERYRDPNYQVVKHLHVPDTREDHSDHANHSETGSSANFRDGYRGTYDYYQDTRRDTSRSDDIYEEPKPRSRFNSLLKLALALLLLIVASPFIGTALAVVGTVAACIVGAAILFLLITIATVLVSIVMTVIGIVLLFTAPLEGLLLFGGSLVCIGCGVLSLVCFYGIVFLFFPWAFRICKNLLNSLLGRRKEARA